MWREWGPHLGLISDCRAAFRHYALCGCSCMWKGRPCRRGAISRRLTDMGVCFTFEDEEMWVGSSGPGSGLSLTLNIEFYEYTKSVDDGIGVKVSILFD